VLEAEIALFDLHRGVAPPTHAVEDLAASGLVRIVTADAWQVLADYRDLQRRIRAVDERREDLRHSFTWPWRRAERSEQIDELSDQLTELNADRADLRSTLHSIGMASDSPEQYVQLSDGRHAKVTSDGANALYEWAFSGACDDHIDADAPPAEAEDCMRIHHRLLAEWKVRYPAPVVAATAALICDAPADERDERLDATMSIFGRWRKQLRSCPADRLLVAAVMAASGEPPGDAADRGRHYQEALREYDFPRERESLWAGALLALYDYPEDELQRVRDVRDRLVRAGWSIQAATYPFAARLTLARGSATEVVSRVEGLYSALDERIIVEEGRSKAVAASILGQSDLFPEPERSSARLLDRTDEHEHMADRVTALHARLPEPPGAAVDARPVTAALLARMPGSTERLWSTLERTREALQDAARHRVRQVNEIDPLTSAALLLMDRAWGERVSNRVFAFEAVTACRNEDYDQLTMFRLSAESDSAWKTSGGGAPSAGAEGVGVS
jgi:hypothetical protein